MKELLMGNEAVALGAMRANVKVVAGYPGTPSTEVLETIAKRNDGTVYVEWSTNEKAALEVAAGASISGARSLVTMKQVGLNVASDPLMSLNYIGIKGGMIIYVADDPGPISSQTEQDTRHFGKYAKIAVFDPTSPSEAYTMIEDAFLCSEQYGMPVILRSTTRICHACNTIELLPKSEDNQTLGFVKSQRWVIFPKLSYANKLLIEKREETLSDDFSQYAGNLIEGSGKIGIACGGVSYAYVKEALKNSVLFTVFKVATPFPFPEKKALEFIKMVDNVIVFEELDPVIEDALVNLCGKHKIPKDIFGKRSKHVPCAGELSPMIIGKILDHTYQMHLSTNDGEYTNRPDTPKRPPVLCAGCPHRASFYAVKQAMKGKKAVYCGDIGCYTLGNAMPLDMTDTCLCMGAGITMAQGINKINGGTNFAFIGDSTFFASGISGITNAIYNQSDIVIIVLDNSTTAMTGHQPHPGIGKTMMHNESTKIDIVKVLKALELSYVKVVNPLDLSKAIKTVSEAAEMSGVRAIVFKAPCVALEKKQSQIVVEDCIGCKKCINDLGCPAIKMKDGIVQIDHSLCNGCTLCVQVCPKKALRKEAI